MKARLALVVIGTSALALSGCGKNYNGAYTGTETISQSNQYGQIYQQPPTGQPGQPAPTTPTTAPANSVSQMLTMTVTEGQNNQITGTWQAGNDTGKIQANANGSGFDNVILTVTPGGTANGVQNGAYGNPYGSPYGYAGGMMYPNSMVMDCGGTFTGNLTLNGNQLTGTLTSAAGAGTACGTTTINVNVTKPN
jgi:hypothetical protein